MEDCPAISLVGETSVSGALAAMDCHINTAVHVGYDRLFGPGGAFGFALSALLVIYVALIGYGFMTGRTRLTLMMMSPRIMTMALVLTFATAWPAYHAIFYGLLMGGPDQVAAALLHVNGSAVMHFAQQLDALFVRFADIARALDDGGAATVTTPNGQVAMALPHAMPVQLFWLSGLCLLVSTLGVLILTRLVLYLLLILGPVFIIFALFPQTRGLFNGWLRTSLVFALAPLLTVLGGTAALMLFAPLINAIGEDPQGAVKAVQPMVILFMGSLIYCAFLFVLMWVAASLVRDWQASFRGRDVAPTTATAVSAGAATAPQPLVSRDAQTRTEPLVSAINRAQEVAAGAANTTARASA
ncbi:MAG TPA: type IV secretion system protein, partial [Asticcacaulis sp.]|nr:type IV secretion system protein [Asticcacaulis sp.]